MWQLIGDRYKRMASQKNAPTGMQTGHLFAWCPALSILSGLSYKQGVVVDISHYKTSEQFFFAHNLARARLCVEEGMTFMSC